MRNRSLDRLGVDADEFDNFLEHLRGPRPEVFREK